MSRTPPDILFTTTEMLNRQMGDSRFGHIFGLGPGVRRPQIMLLDEVHTYDGTAGAQVALLLRRWRHAVGSKVQFTGLSATLRAAAEFFGDLVGLGPGSVDEVSPRHDELDIEPESVEYVLALRGDPGVGDEPALDHDPGGDAPAASPRPRHVTTERWALRPQGVCLHRRPRRHEPALQ